MRFFKLPIITSVALGISLSFIGCSSDGSDSDSIALPPDENSFLPSDKEYTEEEVELLFNHELLGLFYMNAQKELKDADNYMGKGSSSAEYSKSACTAPFTDVCYMYETLEDKFTRYFDPNYANRILQMLTESESAVGIGISVELVEDSILVVTDVIEKSPAGGLLTEGDTILSIDGTRPTSLSAFEKLISGDDGDKIIFDVHSIDGESRKVSVILGEFLSPTVYLRYVDSIPVVKITEFTEETSNDSGTYGEFMNIVKKLDGYKSMVVDLRGNPGGETNQCSDIAAEFLSKNDTIITFIESSIDSTVKKGVTVDYFQVFDTTTYVSGEDGAVKDKYVVFLADENSASCSEIVLAAVTNTKKTPVVGKNTYGKGIGQMIFSTYFEGLALITGIKFIDKEGYTYHKVGIAPDYEISDAEDQLNKAVSIAKEAKEKRSAGYGTVPTGNFKKTKATGPVDVPKNKAEFYNLMTGPYKTKNFKL